MAIAVYEIKTKRDIKQFVKFPFKIYPPDSRWIPLLIKDEMEGFNRKKNPAFRNAEAKFFMAFREKSAVGKVAAIYSPLANKIHDKKNLRFGWFESEDDSAVVQALFRAVEDWGRTLGMETLSGPHGFTDLDPQGLLIEGFDEEPTIASNYNHPYYKNLLEDFGFEKEIDFIEFKANLPQPTEIPENLLRIAERIENRGRFKIKKFKDKKELMKYRDDVFLLLDETYSENYGTVPLSDDQIKYYAKKYFPFVDRELIKIASDENDEFIGFMISLPSLTSGFRKARGQLFPLGWFHILRSLKTHNHLDFYLTGVKKEFRGLGVDLLMALAVVQSASKMGFQSTESNLELETNHKVHGLWKYFNPEMHKRRRLFRKNIH